LFTSVYIVQYNINWCKQVRPKLPWKLPWKMGGGQDWRGCAPWPQRRTAIDYSQNDLYAKLTAL